MKTKYPDKLQVLYPRQEIEVAVARLGEEITREYQGHNPLLLGVLKGSFVFMSDLVRRLDFPLETGFVQLSSYGRGKESSGKIKISHDLKTPVLGKNVLVVEDIVDTGFTLRYLLQTLAGRAPNSLAVCTFLEAFRDQQVNLSRPKSAKAFLDAVKKRFQ